MSKSLVGLAVAIGLCFGSGVAEAHGTRRDIAAFSWPRRTGGVYVLHPDGTGIHKFDDRTPYFVNATTRVSWSPDRSKIAFEAGPEYGEDIYVWSKRTGRVRRITDHPERTIHPSWSPDGRRIAYIHERGDGSDLLVVRADGSGRRRLDRDEAGLSTPEWSPDGSRIVYGSLRGLFVVRPDGSGRTRLTRRAFDVDPSWAPGSRWLVFSRIRTGGRGASLVRVRRNGSRLKAITDSPDRDEEAEWSPDGSRIVFVRTDTADDINPDSFIYSVRPDGRRLKRLTADLSREGSGDFYPEWSPGSGKIAYRRYHTEPDERRPEMNVWIMKRDGSRKRNLTGGRGPGGFFGLDW